MIETQSFNSNLENSIKRIVDSISKEDFQKYLFAKENEIFSSKFYEEMLNKLYEERGGVDLNTLYQEIIRNFEYKERTFTDALSQMIENSIYISKSFILDSVVSDDEYKEIIQQSIDKLDFNNFTSNFVCSDISGANAYVKKLLMDFIKKIIEKSKEGITTEEISTEFIKFFKNNLKNLTSPLKEELKSWYSSFSEKKHFYNLFNELFDYINSNQKIKLDIEKTIKLDSSSFNKQRTNFYDSVFTGDSISNLKFYSTYHLIKDDLIREIVELAYSSASNKSKYVRYGNQRILVCENTHIIPSLVYEKVLSELPDIIDNAMSNYYMFLSGSEVVFSDDDGKKYSFPIDNIHILGLKDNADDIYSYFKQNPVNNYDLVSPKIKGTYNFHGGIDQKIDIKLTNLVSILQNNTIDLRERITALNNAQGIVTKIMTTDDYSQKIDLLIYFYTKKYKDVSLIKENALSRILGYNSSSLLSILEENSYYFGNGFINSFKNDGRVDIIQEFINKYNYSSYREKVIEKFDSIFEMQKYLTYQHSMLATEVLMLRKSDGKHDLLWKQFFSDHILDRKASYLNTSTTLDTISDDYNSSFGIIKLEKSSEDNKYILKCVVDGVEEIICSYRLNDRKNVLSIDDKNPNFDVEFNDKNRLKVHRKDKYDEYLNIVMSEQCINMEYTNKSLGIFSLANTYVYAQKNNFDENFLSKLDSFSSIINVLKIYDKFLYLNQFNFSIDITNLYITDLQADKLPGIICEMLALNSSLFTLYDYVDSNGKMHFVSIQDADSLVTVKSNISLLPSIVNFRSKEYKTLLGFCESKNGTFSNILTQSHSDFKKKKLSLNRILNLLKEEKLILRYGTSGSIVGNYGNVDSLNDVLSNVENLDFIDLLRRNLIGCSNVLLWLESIYYNSFVEFVGSNSVFSEENKTIFNDIKVILYKNVLENISLLIKKIDDEFEYKEILSHLNNYRLTGDPDSLAILINYISNRIDSLKNSKIDGLKDYKIDYLNNLSSVNEIADYLERGLKFIPNGFLLDSQVNDCIQIRKILSSFIDNNSFDLFNSIFSMDSNDLTSFDFIKNMSDVELTQFIDDINLRFPSYLIDFMYSKYESILSNNKLLDSNNKTIKQTVETKRYKNLPSPYSKTTINSLVGPKDQDKNLMLYLDNKVSSYIEYINFSKHRERKRSDNLYAISTMYSELLGYLEQSRTILLKKSKELETQNNKKGIIASVRNYIDDPAVKKEKFDDKLAYLEEQINYYSDIYRFHKNLYLFVKFDSTNINVNVIYELLSLFGCYKNISDEFINILKNKTDDLLKNDELDESIIFSLKLLELRIKSETDLRHYFDEIENELKVRSSKISSLDNRLIDDSMFRYIPNRTYINHNQDELDIAVFNSLSSMYQYVTNYFHDYPEYMNKYLKEIEEKVELMFKKYKKLEYRDLFSLIVLKNEKAMSESVNKVHNSAIINLKDYLKNSDGYDIPDFLINLLSLELAKIDNVCKKYYEQSNAEFVKHSYIMKDGDEDKVKQRLLNVGSNIRIVDDYIGIIMDFLESKVNFILSEYKEYILSYNFTSDELRNEKRKNDEEIIDIISLYLVALYRMLLLKRNDGTQLVDDDKVVGYKNSIDERVVSILKKNLIASPKLFEIVNSSSFEEVFVGKK